MKKLLPMAVALCILLCGCAGGASPTQSAVPAAAPVPETVPVPVPEPQPQPEPEPEPEPEPPTLQEQAALLAAQLTPEQLVGQLFFVRYPGQDELAAQWAGQYHLGGYILFGREFKEDTPEGVRQKIAQCQSAASIPMLMGVDEEGGSVVRASYYPAFRESKFRSPQRVFAQGGMEAVREDGVEKSLFLKDLGLNVNLAPVCDVSTDPNDFIYDRSFGQGARETAEYVETVVSAMAQEGMGSVLKHFPGYGDNADTHTGIAVDQRPLDTFLQEDLLPFAAGVQAGAGAVLVSHNIITCLDGELPASLSPAVYDLLRTQVGFDGVAMTDDMDMQAVAQYAQDGSAAVLALAAGADMVLTSDPRGQIGRVFAALDAGTLSWERVEEAAVRVLVWKLELGLLTP